MTKVTLEAIENLLDLKLEEKLEKKLDEKLDQKLKPIHETLNQHSVLLDTIARSVKNLEEEMVVSNSRVDRLENWGVKVGNKVNIKLEF